MAQPILQHAFHSGEWSPDLFARVDLQQYKAGAAILRNFYVDYRGGASTRQGTRYVNRTFKSATPVRLIPFQPSASTSYVLEFGDGYIRFFSNGAPILETAFTVTSITGNSITAAGNNFVAGDWVNIGGVYYIVLVAGSPFTVSDLWGNASVTPTGSSAARVFTLASPFAAADLFPNPVTGNPGIKFAQSVQSLIICHPTYPPQILTIISANNWTISAITFGSTIGTPTNLAVASSDTPGTTWFYAYIVTAVDVNNQESAPPAPATFSGTNYIGDNSNRIANTISWTAVAGAMSYNIYKATPTFKTIQPVGTIYGFIANVTGTTFLDSFPGIAPDFAQTIPIVENPFAGAGVISYTVTASGAPYTTVPTVNVTGGGGTGATAIASLGITSSSLGANGTGYSVGQICNIFGGPSNTVFATLKVLTVGGGNGILTYSILYAGSITSGTTPSNPLTVSGGGASNATINLTWGVTQVLVATEGSAYTSAPAVAFSAGGAAATAVLGTASAGNPGVPGFLQERLVLANQQQSPASFNMSQPANFFNFNISNPVQPDDAISGTIFSGELNDIKSLTPVPTGILLLSGRLAWIVNGGGGLSAYNPITPANVVANPQTFTGASDLPPLKINQDLLYVTLRENYVRDLSYNVWTNVFTGADISSISSHLFFGHYLTQWTWAEEPFKTVWAVRNDGILLSLAYVKEQETIGWARHDTNGQFKSVTSVLETINGVTVDAVYTVVQRVINSQTVQYVERIADRFFTYGYEDSWSVDAALQTVANVSPTTSLTITGNVSATGNVVTLTDTAGAPFTAGMASSWVVRDAFGGVYTITAFTSSSQVTATVKRVPNTFNQYTNAGFTATGYTIWQPVTTVTNLFQLQGQTVTGVADGVVVPATVVSATGSITLGTAASKITLGLAFTPQLQTLPLDLGAGTETVQGRPKVISAVSVRCADTLGLSIGSSFTTLVPMKDLVVGNLNYYLNSFVTGLVNADARTVIDSQWEIPGQYCIQQSNPYPATILGVIPEFAAGVAR